MKQCQMMNIQGVSKSTIIRYCFIWTVTLILCVNSTQCLDQYSSCPSNSPPPFEKVQRKEFLKNLSDLGTKKKKEKKKLASIPK